jgi:hypothetical protein
MHRFQICTGSPCRVALSGSNNSEPQPHVTGSHNLGPYEPRQDADHVSVAGLTGQHSREAVSATPQSLSSSAGMRYE